MQARDLLSPICLRSGPGEALSPAKNLAFFAPRTRLGFGFPANTKKIK
jgi:hypothetical protein